MRKYSFGEQFLRECLTSGLSIEAELSLEDEEYGSRLFLVSGVADKKQFHICIVVDGRALYYYIEDYDRLLALSVQYLGEENRKELRAFMVSVLEAAI